MPEASFEAHDLVVRFDGKDILCGVTHVFKPRAWTHILGANGAGKSTLLRVLCGLLRPDAGVTQLLGRDIFAYRSFERARHMAYIPQRLDHIPALTVIDFVMQGGYAWIRMESPEAMRLRAESSLREVGILDGTRALNTLSGGELQLCMLASAMAQRAEIILLDEPTSALDIHHAERVCHLLRQMTRRGITVISTMHALSLTQRFADETVLLHRGQCLYHGAGLPPVSALGLAYAMPESYFVSHARVPNIAMTFGDDALPREKTRRTTMRFRTILGISLGALLLLLSMSPWLGATSIWPWEMQDIFWQLRVPRVLWGAVAGATLAVVGGVLQALFQNPLATPYTLGIASGAALGAMSAIQAGVASLWVLTASSSLGGLLTMTIVLWTANRFGPRQPIYGLLAGVAVSMFCSALGLVIQAFATPMTAQQMMRWQLGGLEVAGYASMMIVPIIILSWVILFKLARPLELLSVDAELAATRGLHVARTRNLTLLATGIATAFVVSICGPIGFIGLIVPNGVRHWTGANLRQLLPLSAIHGAIFLLFADMISRLLERIAWIPAGVVTAIIGAPILIVAIFRPRFSRQAP